MSAECRQCGQLTTTPGACLLKECRLSQLGENMQCCECHEPVGELDECNITGCPVRFFRDQPKTAPDAPLNVGRKDDSRKLRWDLVPWAALREGVKAVTFGATKYGDQNWRKVPGARDRYFAALQRHIDAWRGGETFDLESGQPIHHLGCAMACLWFLITDPWPPDPSSS